MINIIVIINMLSSWFQSAINGNFALKIKKNPRVNEMFLFSLFFLFELFARKARPDGCTFS